MDYRKSVVLHVLYIQFMIGLRPGETLALKWSDVDFENPLETENRQGLSIYLGSRQSEMYFNFYEKRYEILS